MTEPLIKVPDVQFERAKLMLDRARWAAAKFQKLDRTATRRIVDAVAAAGHAKAQHYAATRRRRSWSSPAPRA